MCCKGEVVETERSYKGEILVIEMWFWTSPPRRCLERLTRKEDAYIVS